MCVYRHIDSNHSCLSHRIQNLRIILCPSESSFAHSRNTGSHNNRYISPFLSFTIHIISELPHSYHYKQQISEMETKICLQVYRFFVSVFDIYSQSTVFQNSKDQLLLFFLFQVFYVCPTSIESVVKNLYTGRCDGATWIHKFS